MQPEVARQAVQVPVRQASSSPHIHMAEQGGVSEAATHIGPYRHLSFMPSNHAPVRKAWGCLMYAGQML